MEKKSNFLVTIDGPAGVGKSTVSRRLAERIGFDYLDTGAIYRTCALLGDRYGVDWGSPTAPVELISRHKIENYGGRTLLDGEDVSDAIRTIEVTERTHFAADHPQVRRLMTEQIRLAATGRNFVTEGRDQGTAVFPEAFVKFYLTASAKERATRRMRELVERGEHPEFDELLEQIVQRDRRDSTRDVGPLKSPPDGVVIDSDGRSITEVLDSMEQIVIGALGATR